MLVARSSWPNSQTPQSCARWAQEANGQFCQWHAHPTGLVTQPCFGGLHWGLCWVGATQSALAHSAAPLHTPLRRQERRKLTLVTIIQAWARKTVHSRSDGWGGLVLGVVLSVLSAPWLTARCAAPALAAAEELAATLLLPSTSSPVAAAAVQEMHLCKACPRPHSSGPQ